MKASYFPGCTLKTKAKELDIWARKCAEVLGITLEEPADWQCCGGVFSTATDEIASKLAAIRALKAARDAEQPLVTVCSACHNVIKQANHAMQTNADFAARVNNYMADETPYAGETQVLYYLELLRDVVGFDTIAQKVVKPLTGKKIAPYYGCLLLRPAKTMQMDDPENPSIMEDFLRALGAEPVYYAARNECCGGYLSLEDKTAAAKQSGRVLDSAKANGAEAMVTACPLCRYNLIKNGNGAMPVVYITELLAEALGVKEDAAND